MQQKIEYWEIKNDFLHLATATQEKAYYLLDKWAIDFIVLEYVKISKRNVQGFTVEDVKSELTGSEWERVLTCLFHSKTRYVWMKGNSRLVEIRIENDFSQYNKPIKTETFVFEDGTSCKYHFQKLGESRTRVKREKSYLGKVCNYVVYWRETGRKLHVELVQEETMISLPSNLIAA